ncbi:MAG: hypothetical protein H6697_11305 [Myxococcales bacterium]|nr:hypothetical protein [Myxococcales bacterium]
MIQGTVRRALLLAALGAALFITGCSSPDPDPAACDVPCLTAPAPTCDGDTRVTYSAPGVCADGQCFYQDTRTACANGCESGSCVDACSGVSCSSPPPSSCNGNVLTGYGAGTCDADSGECSYASEDADCAANGQVCVTLEAGALCREAEPTCDDGERNGEESDVDCGGASCEPCANGDLCREATDCESSYCEGRRCTAPSCTDGLMDGEETGLDCGGGCAGCANGDACNTGADCRSLSCVEGTCVAATCEDDVQNGSEADVDCGGARCPGCALGTECRDDIDCESANCAAGRCEEPSCNDGSQNGTESDLDCGGSCGECSAGDTCRENEDCRSGLCDAGICTSPSCLDGARGGFETGVDCGGPDCPGCDTGEACGVDFDCASRSCTDDLCDPPSCDDGLRNGDESGIDCGGSTCDRCATSQVCRIASDCESGICFGNRCSAARCTDGVRNGDETDIDCGGETCDPCFPGDTCAVPADCTSLLCDDSTCGTPPTCTDRLRNGTESDVDCGGTICAPCGVGRGCGSPDDCATENCVSGSCGPFASCSDGRQNGTESDVDCGGSCGLCQIGDDCFRDTDCSTRLCVSGSCVGSTCDDDIRGGLETGVDCGGPVCGGCEAGETCGSGLDCASGICTGRVCIAPSCSDGVRNGAEITTDCGGACGGEPCLLECGATDAIDLSALNVNDVEWELAATAFPSGTGTFEIPAGCTTGVAPGAPELIFRFVARRGGWYTFTPAGAGSRVDRPVALYVLDGTCSATASVLGCDAGDGVTGPSLTVPMGEGDRIYIVLDGVTPAVAGRSASIFAADTTPETCDSRRQDGRETDVDCGGPDCAACGNGAMCLENTDCTSRSCRGVCLGPTCDDGVWNGDEVGKDCGGSCGPASDCIVTCPVELGAIDFNATAGTELGVVAGTVDVDRFTPVGPRCFGDRTTVDAVFEFTPSRTATYEFTAVATDFLPVVYALNRCQGLTEELGCATVPDIDGREVTLSLSLTAGEPVFIVVDAATEPTARGAFRLAVARP